MKIKHWSGYGTVKATKVTKKDYNEGVRVLHIKVEGNHERGLEMNEYDTCGVFNWLVKKFDKQANSEVGKTLSFSAVSEFEDANNEYGFIEVCDYYIRYKIF